MFRIMSNSIVNKYNYQTIMRVGYLHKRSYNVIKMWAQSEEERSHCLNENKWLFDTGDFIPNCLDIIRG